MTNWSLLAIPISSLGWVIPLVVKMSLILKAGKFNNKLGRGNVDASKAGLSSTQYDRVKRCVGAEENFYSNYPVYIGGVLALNLVKAPTPLTNALAYGWIAGRVLYSLAYMQDLSYLRTALFNVTMGIQLGMWVVAGRQAV